GLEGQGGVEAAVSVHGHLVLSHVDLAGNDLAALVHGHGGNGAVHLSQAALVSGSVGAAQAGDDGDTGLDLLARAAASGEAQSQSQDHDQSQNFFHVVLLLSKTNIYI